MVWGDFLDVLTLTNEFEEESFGGSGTAATGMTYLFDRLGLRQTVVVPRSNWTVPEWMIRGRKINVLGLPRNTKYFGRLGLIKTEVVRREFSELWRQWDLIHLQAINFTPLAYTLSGGAVPILYSVFSFLRRELGDSLEPELQEQFRIQDELLMRCRKIHLISQSEKDYLAACFPQFRAKAEVLPLGISLPAERWQPRGSYECLYVGRLLDYKGIEDLMRAVNQVCESGRLISLNIVGKGTDSYEAYLRELARSLHLERRVRFYGWVENAQVRQLMGRAMCLVVPSRTEAFGMTALEGMAVGTPLIVSRTGGLKEIASDACALTFEAGNVKQLTEVLKRAFDNPYLLRSLAVEGRKRALEFEWDRLASQYLKILRELEAGGS